MPRNATTSVDSATHFELEGPAQTQHESLSWQQRVLDVLSRGWRGLKPSKGSYEPLEEVEGDRPRFCPEEDASWLARIFFSYFTPVIKRGYARPMQYHDVPDLQRADEAQAIASRFGEQMVRTSTPAAPKGRLLPSMFWLHGRKLLPSTALKLTNMGLMFASPLLLQQLMKAVEDGEPRGKAAGLAVAMLAVSLAETTANNNYLHSLLHMCMQLKSGLTDVLYTKSLRLSSAARLARGTGGVINLQSNDTQKLFWLPFHVLQLMLVPLQVTVTMLLLVNIMSWAPALAGVGVTVILVPAGSFISRRLAAIRREIVCCTDARMKLTTEVLLGIKTIKLYAWEDPFKAQIISLRAEELRHIRRSGYLQVANVFIFLGGPVLVSLSSFMVYALLGKQMSAAMAFPALALFNLLRQPLMMLPNYINSVINARVSIARLQTYLLEPEQAPLPVVAAAEESTPAVTISHASFAFSSEIPPTLHNIDLSLPAACLAVIIGPVGCGKTALLTAILGEMHSSGSAPSVAGSIAYTAQDPFIQNATLRDNILMGRPFREAAYEATLDACALRPDLAVLEGGDLSEIGEKGINLSGGQRHRVALARACYSDADVYILDDPLSAVDAHVGSVLFSQAIMGIMQGSTRILVTHQLQYLPQADVILVLEGGRISARGSYAELCQQGIDLHSLEHSQPDEAQEAQESLSPRKSEHASPAEQAEQAAEDAVTIPLAMESAAPGRDVPGSGAAAAAAGELPEASDPLPETAADAMMAGGPARHHSAHSEEEDRPSPSDSSTTTDAGADSEHGSDEHTKLLDAAETGGKAAGAKGQQQGSFIKVEERATGQVEKRLYWAYLASWGPWFWLPVSILALGFVERCLQAGQSWWLAIWTDAAEVAEKAVMRLGSGADTGYSDTYYLWIYFGLGAASIVLQMSRNTVLVLGSLTAAKRMHQGLLDNVLRLPMSFHDSTPTGRLLNRFARDTEAVDVSLPQASLGFLNSILTVAGGLGLIIFSTPAVVFAIVPLFIIYYRVQAMYVATSRETKRLDSIAQSPIFSNFGETLQGLVTLRAFRRQAACVAAMHKLLDRANQCWWTMMVANRWLSMRLECIGACLVFCGAITSAVVLRSSAGMVGLVVTATLSLTGILNQLMRQLSDVEVQMNSVERVVAYAQIPNVEKAARLPASCPPASWPSRGAIELKGLVIRYRPDLPPVLKGLSLSIRAQEKIGIAGRTGCGKSTLALALFRLVEPDSGSIIIDGVDVSTIGTFDLRSRIALVPQDPVLFSGSVRANIDPFGAAEGDAPIWEALQRVGIKPAIAAMQGGLDAHVAEAGGNLSTGQRQLLCMARAVLRNAQILILDEATSNVDGQTDSLIQDTVRSAFGHCTVLTIAHRLHTILACDRILVLDAGSVAEFGPPQQLLQKPGGAFHNLMQHARTQSL